MLASSRNVITNNQSNDNVVALLGLNPNLATNLVGIYLFGTFGPQNDSIISHCQVSGNRVTDGGSGRTNQLGELIGIFITDFSEPTGFENRTVVEFCQVCDNRMDSSDNSQIVAGITYLSGIDGTISNSFADGNRGGEEAYRIFIWGSPRSLTGPLTSQSGRNMRILNSTANDNISRDFASGILLVGQFDAAADVKAFIENAEVVSCQANRNLAGFAETSGIALQNARGCSVIDCQMDRNSFGFFAGSVLVFLGISIKKIATIA